jgi:Ni,Fe-hydrogenase I cytochrome b subunit
MNEKIFSILVYLCHWGNILPLIIIDVPGNGLSTIIDKPNIN